MSRGIINAQFDDCKFLFSSGHRWIFCFISLAGCRLVYVFEFSNSMKFCFYLEILIFDDKTKCECFSPYFILLCLGQLDDKRSRMVTVMGKRWKSKGKMKGGEVLNPRFKSKSNVWNHFTYEADSNSGRCIVCNQLIKVAKNTSSSNFWKHLRHHHIFPKIGYYIKPI